jgi:L-ascorbate metabolism protein UlaG (beta-lactamase superfamily)
VRPAIARPYGAGRAAFPIALTVLALLGAGCAGPGGSKPGAPSHHLERGFRNTNPAFARPSAWVRWPFIIRRIFSQTFRPRTARLPVLPNDGRTLRENRTEATVTWVGHSTLLVQLDGVNLLTDPQWSDRASPVGFMGPRRVTPPGLRMEDLPPIHLVLISHDHYDHLDAPTVQRLHALHRPRFLVPLGLRAWFESLGITDVEELDWWESRTVGGLTLTCVPAQHFGSRTLWDYNRRLWSGWTVAGRDRRLYFAGDSGYYDLFREIGRRLGPFDLAAISIGAYLPAAIMQQTHTTPEESLRVFEDVGARRFVAIHWGTFDLAEEPIEEPPERLLSEARRVGIDPDRIWVLKHGESRRF